MAALSREAGLSETAIRVALRRPFRRAEEALIGFLGVPPHHIFPGRYDASGTRLVTRGRKPSLGGKPTRRWRDGQ